MNSHSRNHFLVLNISPDICLNKLPLILQNRQVSIECITNDLTPNHFLKPLHTAISKLSKPKKSPLPHIRASHCWLSPIMSELLTFFAHIKNYAHKSVYPSRSISINKSPLHHVSLIAAQFYSQAIIPSESISMSLLTSWTPKSVPAGMKNSRSEGFWLAKHRTKTSPPW